MNWSKEQTEAFQRSYENFREIYTKDENRKTSIDAIHNDKRRCITLINRVYRSEIFDIQNELRGISKFYHQEIPHFTIDCHRYLTADKIPAEINSLSLSDQISTTISPAEFSAYDKILEEILVREKAFNFEMNGIAIGGDGLIVQIWYDHNRMQDLTDRLGEKVRKEVPSMDFQWGIVKNKVPIRVLNLTRFTGEENKEGVLEYVEKNKEREIAKFKSDEFGLFFSDHYIQESNTLGIKKYNLSG